MTKGLIVKLFTNLQKIFSKTFSFRDSHYILFQNYIDLDSKCQKNIFHATSKNQWTKQSCS